MNRIARLIGLVLCFLAVFLAAVFASWLRLRNQTEILKQASITAKAHQLERVLALSEPKGFPWSEDYLKELNTILDANILVVPSAPISDQLAEKRGPWHFDHPLLNAQGEKVAVLSVDFSPPPAVRLGHLYRHTALILLMLALGLITILVIVLLLSLDPKRTSQSGDTTAQNQASREMGSLTHLARLSASQHAELERERIERLRADEDVHYQQVLLNRALEEKIRLGQELHDGIIQSLYATGLTLEMAKKQLSSAPAEAAKHLEAGTQALNTTIREVRSYINGLAPQSIQHESFTKAVEALTHTLGSGRQASFDLRIDESAASRLSDERRTNLLQIIRESISNSFRHGNASHITVRLHESDTEIGLLVQDNGRGFDPARASRGHGLDNIKARAERVHAALRITSAPNEGTRTVVTLPIESASST